MTNSELNKAVCEALAIENCPASDLEDAIHAIKKLGRRFSLVHHLPYGTDHRQGWRVLIEGVLATDGLTDNLPEAICKAILAVKDGTVTFQYGPAFPGK